MRSSFPGFSGVRATPVVSTTREEVMDDRRSVCGECAEAEAKASAACWEESGAPGRGKNAAEAWWFRLD